MNNRGYTGVELLVVIGLFSIGYFLVANKLSYNFDVSYEEDLYELKINSIETQAGLYGETNQALFSEGNEVYMTVEDLAYANAIISNSEGVVKDPRDENKTLNDLKVKIINDSDKVTAKVLV